MTTTQKEEYRYLFAGMAMHAILSSALQEEDPKAALRMMLHKSMEGTAILAVDYADALIKELESREKDEK